MALFLSAYEMVIFEGHDLTAAEKVLFNESQEPVFEALVLMPDQALGMAATFELIGPVELADAFLHHRGMAFMIDGQLIEVAKVKLLMLSPEMRFGDSAAAMDRCESLPFLLHELRRADPTVMVDMGVDPGDL
jgi:hypothetical protein